MKYTVIVNDYSESRSLINSIPTTHSVQVEGERPLDAASIGEITIASSIWERRYPERPGPWEEHSPEADDDWIDCMESVGVVVVIEGHPKTYLDDDIYDPPITTTEES